MVEFVRLPTTQECYMRLLETAWRVVVVALLVAVVSLLVSISDSLQRISAPNRSLAPVASSAPVEPRAQTQAEWQAEQDAAQRRIAERVLGPDEAKTLMERQAAAAARRAAPK